MSDRELVQRGYRVTGRVQGVCFRAWTMELASGLGLAGTVRNREDGSVEAHARGPREVVETFESRLWEGPAAARVDGVERRDSHAALPADFRILY